MPGSYVPPHLRNKAPNGPSRESQGAQIEERFTLEEIQDYFWKEGERAQVDNGRFPSSSPLNKTLHDSRETPGKLAFVILFEGANPRWSTDHILFTKSNLELLPSDRAGDHAKEHAAEVKEQVEGTEATLANGGKEAEATRHPIAVFKQVGPSQTGRSFDFEGWYKIALVDFLEPGSPELVRMLEQKWTKSKGGKTTQEARPSESWQRSLALRWAVVKFMKDEVAEKELGVPKIGRKPDEPKRSVNEMLAEMRVKNSTNMSLTKVSESSKTEDSAHADAAAEAGKGKKTE